MTPEELDKARAKEADRLWGEAESRVGELSALQVAARLAREGWTPPEPEPEPVDPDILAWREWGKRNLLDRDIRLDCDIDAGEHDSLPEAQAYLAGARMAREQEQERAKVLVEYVEIDAVRLDDVGDHAHNVLAKYRGEA